MGTASPVSNAERRSDPEMQEPNKSWPKFSHDKREASGSSHVNLYCLASRVIVCIKDTIEDEALYSSPIAGAMLTGSFDANNEGDTTSIDERNTHVPVQICLPRCKSD